MKTIAELLTRDLVRPIEEVIKLEQQDEQTVYEEITEYVATERIRKQYVEVLQAIADAPGQPTEGVGVWISGFFGSGKSSFAKNLGYVLTNRTVRGHPASELFVQQLENQAKNDRLVGKIRDLLDFINHRFQALVVMFDVQVDRAVRRSTEPIAEIMYTVLLRELDYAQDYDLAELEIALEQEGRLGTFVETCAEMFGGQLKERPSAVPLPGTLTKVSPEAYAVWRQVRMGAERFPRASAVLNRMDPATYPTPDSWATSLHGQADITIRTLVNRTFELAARRRPGQAVIFIIDEVGQYVARSVDKIENLRAVLEQFGVESKNRVQAGKAVAPVWVMVTSQEKLDEVVAAIDDKRVELARLQDRFVIRIDLSPADIREVATRRVLAKKDKAVPVLEQRFKQSSAMLKTHTRLERTSRHFDVSVAEFVEYYPYLPHFVDLSIDIVSGMRLQPGAPRHIGGSSRTLIKQAYEMLVSDRTALGKASVGELVTLDRIYDLIEGNLSNEKQKDMADIAQRWNDSHAAWTVRTAKAISLLEYVRDLPRTEANLAALLYRGLDEDSPLAHVQKAVEVLHKAQFIRQTESGWKLQTALEKSWATERNAINPTPRDRKEILEQRLREILSAPALSRYSYFKRNFQVGVSWDGRLLTGGDSQVPIFLRIADDLKTFDASCQAARQESQAAAQQETLFWVTYLTAEIDDCVADLHRSRQMVGKYDLLRAQSKITKEEASSLADEKTEALRLEERLRERLEEQLGHGTGFFRGVAKASPSLGKTLPEILKAFFDYAVPELYPKLEMGARPLKGTEAEEILKAANLNGLSKVFYDPPDGFQLVVKEGIKYVVNLNAPLLKEVADYLAREHAYGNKVTGRDLENHFGGITYGWERDVLWLALATLLRGGAVEVTYQGRRFRNHLDAQARVPFAATNAFRAASFAPRKAPDLKTLVAAARRFESLTGEEVDVDETAIALAFQRLARAELDSLLPLEAIVQVHKIAVGPLLQEYRATLETVLSSASDDCVNMLAGEGTSLQSARDRVVVIRKGTDEKGLARLQRIRVAVQRIWPLLEAEGQDGKLGSQAHLLQQCLEEGTYFQTSSERDGALKGLEARYQQLYTERHGKRMQAYEQAIDDVKAQPSWLELLRGQPAPKELESSLLKPLADRCGHDLELTAGAIACSICGASLAEMTSDLAAVNGLRSGVLLRLQEMATPHEKVERLRVADVVGVGTTLGTEEEVESMLQQLRGQLLRLIAAGVKIVLE